MTDHPEIEQYDPNEELPWLDQPPTSPRVASPLVDDGSLYGFRHASEFIDEFLRNWTSSHTHGARGAK